LAGYELSSEELLLKKEFKGDTSIFQAEASQDGTLLVVLDTRQDERVLAQATARELVNRVQKLRKRVGLKLSDVVEIYYETEDKGMIEVSRTTAHNLLSGWTTRSLATCHDTLRCGSRN